MMGPSGGCEPSSKASLQWKPWHLHLTHVLLELSNTLIESIRLKSPWFNQNLHPFHVHDISPAVKSIPHYRHDFDDRLENGLDVSDAFTLGWEEAALTGNRAIQKSLQRFIIVPMNWFNIFQVNFRDFLSPRCLLLVSVMFWLTNQLIINCWRCAFSKKHVDGSVPGTSCPNLCCTNKTTSNLKPFIGPLAVSTVFKSEKYEWNWTTFKTLMTFIVLIGS